ncbi:winged helix-turn-helix transcriptional regulator [Nocardia sp. NPDC052278]|uniref:winged helix-turn-helix transcriptional regulator n=1 Tax=unclassified Nocardia TaxID=2637762 RepID=UPI00369C69D9
MLHKTYENQVCSIARALEVVGERWSLLIVRDALFRGSYRFGDFQRNLGIATNVLSTRLDWFVECGILERRKTSGDHDRPEYVLTAKGRALAPVLVALTEWGDQWVTDGEPPIVYTHATCGAYVGQHTVCLECGSIHDAAEIQATPGPGLLATATGR